MGKATIEASVRFNPKTSKRFAVVIGSNYVGSKVRSLHACENDAHSVADTLSACNYTTITLLGAEATYQAITEALSQVGLAAGADGLVIVYFTGHAAYSKYEKEAPRLIPHDADPHTLQVNTLSLEDLAQSYLK